MLRYSVDKTKTSYAQVRRLACKKDEGKFQQIACVTYEVEIFFYQLKVPNSLFDEDFTDKLFLRSYRGNCNYLLFTTFHPIRVEALAMVETYFSS